MRARFAWILLCGCMLVASCATAPSLWPIAGGEAVSFQVVASSRYPDLIDVRNTAMGDGLSAGIGTGGVVGGLWGLSCGPFAFLCVPLGASVGILTGAAAGAAVGATGGLSQDKQDQVKERLVRLEQTHPLVPELRRQIGDRAQKYWAVSAEGVPTVVNIELQALQVATTRDERLSFVMRVVVSQRAGSASGQAGARQKAYEYTSPFGSMAVWMDPQSDFLDTSFASACQQIAAQVIADLAVR
jgi:hypothetical protein